MFEDVSQKNALRSIKSLLEDGEINKTQYAVWWHGKLVSPAKVISKHYELQGKPINRRGFNTDQAQKRLLKLGFPIVDTKGNHNFFTKTELESFKLLIALKEYDPSNTVDINIGAFLRDVIWSKTKTWAEKLEELGWDTVSKRRGWNARGTKEGKQSYKQYTWCSVKPSNEQNNLLLFTVGVDNNGDIEYKMDIQWNSPEFSQQQIDLFYDLRSNLGADPRVVSKDEILKYSWEKLIKESDNYFSSHLATYSTIYSALWPQKRLMRLVYNVNKWHRPSGHKWKKKNQGNPNIAHHNQYGFGAEEWLFNPRYHLNGFQYGYVRGVEKMPFGESTIDELILFTIDPNTNKRLLVGILRNVELLVDDKTSTSSKLYKKYFDTMIDELKEVDADYRNFIKNEFVPNLKFEWSKADVFDELIEIENLDNSKYNRFIPYEIEGGLEQTLIASLHEAGLNFNEGINLGKKVYERTNSGGKTIVTKDHVTIMDDLGRFVKQDNSFENPKISIEKTRINRNLIDGVISENEGLTIFEAKTMSLALSNIRQALGQVLEYSLLVSDIKLKKMVIIGPAIPSTMELEYLQKLKKTIAIPLEYWAYSFNEKELKNKFKKY